MPSSLDITARQTLFIVKEAPTTAKLSVPRDWQIVTVSNDEQLFACLVRAAAGLQRVVFIVDEEHFHPVLNLIRHRTPKERFHNFGFLVVCKEPKYFFVDANLTSELLDVVAEKDLRKRVEFHLLQALRHLVRSDERVKQKIGIRTLEHLNQIFIELSAERNPERLLATILCKGMELTSSTSGALHMVEEVDGEVCFRLKITNDNSHEVHFTHLNNKLVEGTFAGYVALTGKILNIPDVHNMKPLVYPQFQRGFEPISDTKVVSILAVPFKNSRNEILAVLELTNKRSDNPEHLAPMPFDTEDESLVNSFSTQAAVCLENVDLYADVQRLFEGFVKASITAIESRDPSTGGHSERVAKMCIALARATTECNVGIYRSVKFKEEEIRELEYAALLHDFGKIGVREEVLVKAKKLYAYQLDGIKERIKICKAAARIICLEKTLKHPSDAKRWEAEYHKRVVEIDNYWEIILQANEPNILRKEGLAALDRIHNEQLLLPDGNQIALLSEEEYRALSVTQGSLTDMERLEIESHVRHTYQFLKMIPWTKDFRHLTEIAYCHHEKLDGTGYPRGLTAHEIPLQSKIMTIADIFDALTAADRWYKEAVPTEKALAILNQEVTAGKIDPVLFELFVEKKIFELSTPRGIQQVVA